MQRREAQTFDVTDAISVIGTNFYGSMAKLQDAPSLGLGGEIRGDGNSSTATIFYE